VSFSPLSVVILKGSPAEATSRPHPALAGHVSLFWALTLERGPHRVRSLPDGCVDLTFDLAAATPAAHVTGPQLEPRTFELEGRVALLGVRLLPGAAPTLLGAQVGSDDLWVPLARWLGDDATTLAASVARAPDTAARIERLEAWLAGRLLGLEDPDVARAIARIFDSGGAGRIGDLARAAGMSERALSRLFAARVGLSPKRFSRVVRFQQVLRRLDGQPDWAQLAADLGYFDQAHMIREFKALFGCTPGEAFALVGPARAG
jgi:AraC-like DNA-binding protein